MGKQKELEGFERQVIKEVEDAAEVYVNSRNKRMEASEAEVADKLALIEVMKKHKLTVYALPDDGLVVTITTGKPNVKVTESDDADGDDDGQPDSGAKVN